MWIVQKLPQLKQKSLKEEGLLLSARLTPGLEIISLKDLYNLCAQYQD